MDLGNEIRDKLASWSDGDVYLSGEERRANAGQRQVGKALIRELKEKLVTKKATLSSKADLIDFEWHVSRVQILYKQFNDLEEDIYHPLYHAHVMTSSITYLIFEDQPSSIEIYLR